MISYFVHNLDSYSGALLLARHLNRKVLIKSLKNINIMTWLIYHKISFILFFTLKYKIAIYHFHGSFNIGKRWF